MKYKSIQQELLNNFIKIAHRAYRNGDNFTSDYIDTAVKKLRNYFHKMNDSVLEIPCPDCEGKGCYCEFTDLCGVGEKCIDTEEYGSRKCKSCNGTGKVKAVIMED